MEPVTINFEGLSEFATQLGPYGHLVGHAMAAMFFGMITWRAAAGAGRCYGENKNMEGNSYIAKAFMSGFVGLFGLIMVMVIAASLFDVSLDKAKSLQRTALPLSTYMVEGHDAKAVVINTKRPLDIEDLHNLKWLTLEVNSFCLDEPSCLSRYVARCNDYEIPITQILTTDEAGDTICVYRDDPS